MARRVIHELIDDIDGKAADETVTFAIDGVTYEIDLSSKNAAKLREVLAPYVAAGTRQSGKYLRALPGGRAAYPKKNKTAAEKEESQRIRAWANDHGHKVTGRGRIAGEVLAAYAAAGSPTSWGKPKAVKVVPQKAGPASAKKTVQAPAPAAPDFVAATG